METKFMFGRLLGEIYRLQKRLDMCKASDATIYGLINGIEEIVDSELKSDVITYGDCNAVAGILRQYYTDIEKLNNFSGFQQVENDLRDIGIGRLKAYKIFTLFYAERRFVELLDKMNSNDFQIECVDLKITE